MPFELQAVAWSTLILFVLLMFQGGLVPVSQGLRWGLGGRDGGLEKSALQGRTARTAANHIESMLLFVPLVMIAQFSNISTPLTVWGAGLYLVGRVAFAPLYLFGIPIVRSMAWTVAIIGICMTGFEVFRAFL